MSDTSAGGSTVNSQVKRERRTQSAPALPRLSYTARVPLDVRSVPGQSDDQAGDMMTVRTRSCQKDRPRPGVRLLTLSAAEAAANAMTAELDRGMDRRDRGHQGRPAVRAVVITVRAGLLRGRGPVVARATRRWRGRPRLPARADAAVLPCVSPHATCRFPSLQPSMARP